MSDYLLDTNILLRIVQPEASSHRQAVEAVASILARGDNLFITPQILIEFWAVATRPVDANGMGWPPVLAETEIQQLRAQFPLLDDRPEVFVNWLQLVSQNGVQGKKVHDARLVAVMQSYAISQLLTFNGDDFRRYAAITAVHPNEVVR
ncbi:MAG: PIN domain-containing protein [Anaerolineae bacterium]|nr:PIN domain-containing protein [Anaerolineae bacterium]